MAVFQACVTLDTVQQPQVWISLTPPPKKRGIQSVKNLKYERIKRWALQHRADTGSPLKHSALMPASVLNMHSAS